MQEIMIGQKIRQMRGLKGYSQEYMAEKLSISVTAYSKLERGDTSLSWDRLEQIAKVLEIEPQKMISFDGGSFFADNHSNNILNSFGEPKARRNYSTP